MVYIKLREIREMRGLSLKELADLSSVDKGHLSKIEAGITKNVGINTLIKIATALHVDINDLIEK